MRMKFLITIALTHIFIFMSLSIGYGEDVLKDIKIIGVHSRRYQDRKLGPMCEVYGEIQNISNKPLEEVRFVIELLDSTGKSVSKEDGAAKLVQPAPNIAGGITPLRPGAFGEFLYKIKNCPQEWQEGRVRFQINGIVSAK